MTYAVYMQIRPNLYSAKAKTFDLVCTYGSSLGCMPCTCICGTAAWLEEAALSQQQPLAAASSSSIPWSGRSSLQMQLTHMYTKHAANNLQDWGISCCWADGGCCCCCCWANPYKQCFTFNNTLEMHTWAAKEPVLCVEAATTLTNTCGPTRVPRPVLVLILACPVVSSGSANWWDGPGGVGGARGCSWAGGKSVVATGGGLGR